MTCDELRPEYGAYALGIAEDPERGEISQHLSIACPVCVAGVRSATATVAAMSLAVKDVEPPSRLKKRVVGMVGTERKWGWGTLFPWGVAAALAMVLLTVAVTGRLRTHPDTAKLEAALSILNDPATRDVSFGDPKARGRVFVSPGKGVVFIAAHLPRLNAGRTFEMWVLPAQGNPIPAGTFHAEDDSTAVHLRPGPVGDIAAVAVTEEPEGGSPQPTSTPFIVTKL